jgi:sulfofructose kinase
MKASQVDVVGVGLNATDTLISVSEFPAFGSKVEVRSIAHLPGGQAATALVACQRWGLCCRYVGKLGDDIAAKIHYEAFAEAGVESHIATVPDCSSAQSFIIIDPDGERTVLWQRDERLALQPGELHHEWIVNARALLVDGADTAAATQAAQWGRSAGIPVIADLDAVYPQMEPLLQSIDYLIASRDFPEKITGEGDLLQSLPELQRRFGSQVAGATLGTDGVLVWDGKQFHYSAAFHVPVADTTGAGDIFHAGFIYGLLQNWEMPRILDFACAAAALNCMKPGARGGIERIEIIQQLMANGKRYSAPFQL